MRLLLILLFLQSLTWATIKNADGSEYINENGDTFTSGKITVERSGDTYRSSGKAYKVKQSKDSFKIYDGEKLLWKIKLYDDKLKISNNNENSLPWQIKHKGDKAKIYDSDEVEQGRVYFEDKTIIIKDKNKKSLYKIKADKLVLAPGVFLIKDIPLAQKIIIYSELSLLKK